MNRAFALLGIFIAVQVQAAPEDAVVKVPSHGGSAVVIQTGEGYTYFLTAGHLFSTAAEKRKPIVIDAPSPVVGAQRRANVRLLKMDLREPDTDLALMMMDVGPLPYVCPVAGGEEHRLSDDIISVGYDEMKPLTVRKATVCAVEPGWIYTMQRPWHGRSGGALIDRKANRVIGIVSRYEGNPGAPQQGQIGTRGCYVSRKAIIAFLTGPDLAEGRNGRRGGGMYADRPGLESLGPRFQPFYGGSPLPSGGEGQPCPT